LRVPVFAVDIGWCHARQSPGSGGHGVGMTGSYALIGILLGFFGLGAAMPLLTVAYASRSGFMRVRNWLLTRMERVRWGFALLLGAMGVRHTDQQ
jgi:cytochrome c biogenesis protein CcdA